jgi:hypothetical protein
MGIFGAITGLIGGIQGASAASDAADEQVKGYETSANTVDKTVAGINPLIAGAYKTAGENVLGATGAAADAYLGASGAAGDAVSGAAHAAAAGVNGAAVDANGLLNPYISAGGDATATLSQLAQNPEQFQFTEDDPSYQFRLKEGQKALERSAAGRGGLQSGSTLKALTNYSQGAASQEYAAAFDRFQRQQATRSANLTALAGFGLSAGGHAGDNLLGAAKYGGDTVLSGEKLAGDYRVGGEKVAGDYRVGGTTYAADAGTRSAVLQADNTLQAGLYRAGSERGIGDARAAEHIGRANAWNGALSAIGSGADSILAGGFSGGKGFKLSDAVRYGS